MRVFGFARKIYLSLDVCKRGGESTFTQCSHIESQKPKIVIPELRNGIRSKRAYLIQKSVVREWSRKVRERCNPGYGVCVRVRTP